MILEDTKKVCGRCKLCVKDDGSPYCVMKDLFTTVKLTDECSEFDVTGEQYFIPEREE